MDLAGEDVRFVEEDTSLCTKARWFFVSGVVHDTSTMRLERILFEGPGGSWTVLMGNARKDLWVPG